MYRLPVRDEAFTPVKEPAVIIVFKGGVGTVQQVFCVLLDKFLLEPGVRAYHRFCERGIHLHGDLLEFNGSFGIFGPEDPALLQDHPDHELVCVADAWCPDNSHTQIWSIIPSIFVEVRAGECPGFPDCLHYYISQNRAA